MDNVDLLKDVYRITRELFGFEFGDKETSGLFGFRNFRDGIKYTEGQSSMPIALIFGDDTFFGIATPFGRFEFKFACMYKKEYIDGLLERANTLFDAVEVQNPEERFSSIFWDVPRIFPLRKLPWKKEALPPFTFGKKEDQPDEKLIEKVYEDWNNYIEKINGAKSK